MRQTAREWRPRRRRLGAVLVPAALALLRVVDADEHEHSFWKDPPEHDRGNPNVLGYGPAAGALIIDRNELQRLRTSFGRISDELHMILGVIDQHLASPPLPASTNWPEDGGPRISRQGHPDEAMPRYTAPPSQAGAQPQDFVSTSAGWCWTLGEWLVWAALIVLDIGIVVMMQLFLESIGRKRGGGSIMTKQKAATLAAKQAANGNEALAGSPIPAPSATSLPSSTQRLSVLSQEELLAAALSEHWQKVVLGIAIAIVLRLPALFMSADSLTCNMLMNLTIMVRCMSVVMLLLGDEMTLPKKVGLNQPPGPPSPSGAGAREGPKSR